MPKLPSLIRLIKSNYELLVNENKIFLFLQKCPKSVVTNRLFYLGITRIGF